MNNGAILEKSNGITAIPLLLGTIQINCNMSGNMLYCLNVQPCYRVCWPHSKENGGDAYEKSF